MGYEEALKEAGADVVSFKAFGGWQGDWWAHVYWKGDEGYIHGWYGSCSGCDAFQAEFGCIECDSAWDENHNKEECIYCKSYKRKLKDFGKGYLENSFYLKDEAIKLASKDINWDPGAEEAILWILKN